MAATLECWSSRSSADEDIVEQVLMWTEDRSEGCCSAGSGSLSSDRLESASTVQKRLQKLSRNLSEAIASFKNSLSFDTPRDQQMINSSSAESKSESCRKVVWGNVVRNLTQLYPGSQLPEKLMSNIRKHYESLPLSYAQAGFGMKEVFLHIKLIEQASEGNHPAMLIQEVSDDDTNGSLFKLTFACNSLISWSAMSGELDSASICCNKIQIFEKKGFTLGIIFLSVQTGEEKLFKSRIESALKSSVRKHKTSTVKLPFGLCGCQEDSSKGRYFREIEDESYETTYRNRVEYMGTEIQLEMPLPATSFVVSVDEWQTIQSGREEIQKCLLNTDSLELVEQVGINSFKGNYKGKPVGIEKLKGCDKGNSYDFEIRKDLFELMTCGHKNILQFYGVCIDETHGLCVVTKLMEGGSLHDLMLKTKKLQTKDIIRIAADVAEGVKFMNDHSVAYRDLNAHKILLDRYGNACLGDMGIITACKSVGEAVEYEMDGYRWLAPEIIAGDPENVTETWMSNAYSFGMVLWEMVTGEAAYASCSPVQAAVGIAACGLRPDIPKDCPQVLKFLMTKCWNSCPSKRPQFSEILSTLLRPDSITTSASR